MNKKILVLASVYGFLESFEINDIKILLSLGYEVHTAANLHDTTIGSNYTTKKIDELESIKKHFFDIHRSPFSLKNIGVFFKLKKLVKKEKFDVIHCHTPIGGVLGRLLGKVCGVKVIYTAHGFHFFKGVSKKNWLCYYPIEHFLSKYTDILITINEEDYNLAKLKFNAKNIFKINGVGLDTKKFYIENFDKKSYREKLGLNGEDFVILSVGELSDRKNHIIGIKVIQELKNEYPEISFKYLIVGNGVNLEKYQEYIKENNLENNVKLLGRRNDIVELNMISDIFLFPSLQEGLPVALMEAIAGGKPIICSNIRGNEDLIKNKKNGFLYDNPNINELKEKIKILLFNKELYQKFGEYNLEFIKKFDIKEIEKSMRNIYLSLENNKN
jgi:yveN, capsular polysaccharide biosynthesis protein, glycosyl transferase family 4